MGREVLRLFGKKNRYRFIWSRSYVIGRKTFYLRMKYRENQFFLQLFYLGLAPEARKFSVTFRLTNGGQETNSIGNVIIPINDINEDNVLQHKATLVIGEKTAR